MAANNGKKLEDSFVVDLFEPAETTEASMKKGRDFFDRWAEKYEQDTSAHGYMGPKYCLQLMLKHVPNKDAYTLIVGAGTGLDGQLLYDAGYQKLDGHDGSAEMLKIAEKRQIFRNLFVELLMPNSRSKLLSDTYDALVCVGCFCPNQLNDDHVEDLLRTVKIGGQIIIGTREIFTKDPGGDFDWHYNLDDKINELEKQDKVKVIEKMRTPDYHEGYSGMFYVMTKC